MPISINLGARARARTLFASVAFVLAALLVASLAASPAVAQRTAKARYGEWDMRCETPPGAAKEQCYLVQSISPEDRPNITLAVIVLKTADGKSRLLRAIAPLGVQLTKGLGLKIDQGEIGHAPFARCLPNGCFAEVDMDDKLIEQLGAGHTATFVIFLVPEEGLGIPVPLAGFKEGFEKLP